MLKAGKDLEIYPQMLIKLNIMSKEDQLLAQCVLLERMLKDKLDEFVEEVKKEKPALANIIRKDVQTLIRNHENFYKYIRPHVGMEIFEDFEELQKIIEKYFEDE